MMVWSPPPEGKQFVAMAMPPRAEDVLEGKVVEHRPAGDARRTKMAMLPGARQQHSPVGDAPRRKTVTKPEDTITPFTVPWTVSKAARHNGPRWRRRRKATFSVPESTIVPTGPAAGDNVLKAAVDHRAAGHATGRDDHGGRWSRGTVPLASAGRRARGNRGPRGHEAESPYHRRRCCRKPPEKDDPAGNGGPRRRLPPPPARTTVREDGTTIGNGFSTPAIGDNGFRSRCRWTKTVSKPPARKRRIRHTAGGDDFRRRPRAQ